MLEHKNKFPALALPMDHEVRLLQCVLPISTSCLCVRIALRLGIYPSLKVPKALQSKLAL
jgi:hypothetical protein